MRFAKFIRRYIGVVCIPGLAAVFAVAGAAQDPYSNPPNAFPATGIYPTGSYAPGDIESVNTVNGNVTLKFPLGQMPAGPGGTSAGMTLIYNSAIYDAPIDPTSSTQATMTYIPSAHGGGWSFGYKYTLWAQPRIPLSTTVMQGVCGLLTSAEKQYWYKNFIQTPDGSNHILYLVSATPATNDPNPMADPSATGFLSTDFAGFGNPSGCVSSQQQYIGTLVFATVDNTAIRVEVQTNPGGAYPPWVAYFPDGSQVSGPVETTYGGPSWYGDDSPASQIKDRNGNILTISATCKPNTQCQDTIQDSYGREVAIEYVSSGLIGNGWTDTITSTGPNGTLTTSVNSAINNYYGINYECVTTVNGYQSGSTACPLNEFLWQVTSIEMPATADLKATTFAFAYGPANGGFGELHQVQKCVGVSLTSCSPYQWQTNYTYAFDASPTTRPPGATINPITSKTLRYTENLAGTLTSQSETTNYSIYYPSNAYQINGGISFTSNTITDPDDGVTHLSLVSLCQNATVARDSCSPVVNKTVRPDGSRTEVAWAWNTSLPGDVPAGTLFNLYPQWTLDTDAANLYSKGSQTIEDPNGNTTNLMQYNWMPANSSLINRSQALNNTFESISCGSPQPCPMQNIAVSYWYGSGTTPIPYWTATASGAQNFLRATNTVTLGSTPLTSYAYDNPATTGNVTQVSNWDSASNAWISQTQSYLLSGSVVNGNVTISTDANGVPTATCYGTDNIYPGKQVVAASSTGCPSPTERAEGQTTTFAYDFNSGALTSATDTDNNITTSYAYDNLGRQTTATETSTSLSRTSSTTYDDVNMAVTTSQTNTPYTAVTSTTDYDPLGRVRQSVDGDGNTIDKAYRYLSNGTSVELQSNPYTSSSDASILGWTLTTRDSVGRVKEVDHYNGSSPPSPWTGSPTLTGTSTIQYDQTASGCAGPATKVTDEAGNTRINCPDGLGRLVSVTEPDPVSGGAGTVTTYTYDALNNLSAVDVSGETSRHARPGQFDSAPAMFCLQYALAAYLGHESRERNYLVHV